MQTGVTISSKRWRWYRDGDAWIKLYLATSLLLVIGLGGAAALAPTWIQAGLHHVDERWTRRLDRAEALLSGGRYEQAIAAFSRLDRVFPAPSVKYKRDRQRERLLGGWADALEHGGHRSRAIEVLRRLVAFDPRNAANHYLLGCALRRDRDRDGALESFARVLDINPSDGPTTAAVIDLHYAAGRFDAVVADWRRYLDAVRFARVSMSAGDQRLVTDVVVDGRPHTIDGPLNLDVGFEGTLQLEARSGEDHPHAAAMIVEGVWLDAPLRWGQPQQAAPVALVGRSKSVQQDGGLSLRVNGLAQSAGRVRIQLRLMKTIDADTWDRVQRSYQNELAFDALDAVRRRVVVQ